MVRLLIDGVGGSFGTDPCDPRAILAGRLFADLGDDAAVDEHAYLGVRVVPAAHEEPDELPLVPELDDADELPEPPNKLLKTELTADVMVFLSTLNRRRILLCW